MDDLPTPEQLRSAARASMIIAYAAGLAGIAAGSLLLRDGDVTLAIVVWVITFAVGACLAGIALLLRAFHALAAMLTWLRRDVRGIERADQALTDTTPPASDAPRSRRQPRRATS